MRKLICICILICLMIVPDMSGGTGWWKLYFTSPGASDIKSARKNPRAGLVSIIGSSKKYVHGAFYEISEPKIVSALIDARKRGVDVKLVAESDRMRKRGLVRKQLEDAGIAVVTDNRRGLMHNKFAIIDGQYVWSGSYNPTVNDTEKNNNNAILIFSTVLSEIYEKEFKEMFEENIFGNKKEVGPFANVGSDYYVKIDGTDINIYFSPENNVERIIVNRLLKAKSTIHFMAFAFTSDRIGEAMIQKFKKGVAVYGVFERKGTKDSHSEYGKMKLEGLPVRLDRNRNLMHHKVIIIDEHLVITGSYNYSRNAREFNDENVLMIDNREIAAEYLAEFKRLYR